MNKINVTISLYFEIDSGEEVLYAAVNVDLRTEDLRSFVLSEYAAGQLENIAEVCHVPVENVKIVSRNIYEQNTEDEE